MRCQYTTARISRRWPLAVFFAMLDIGGINATVLYRLNKGKEVTRCTYLRNPTRSLVIKHVQCRLSIDQTPGEVFGVDAPDREENTGLGDFIFVLTTHNRKTTTQCVYCEHYIC